MAAIGEQFTDFLGDNDDVCGLSFSPREKDDLIQIWNINSKAVEASRVLEKVHELVPDVRFNAEFYKRKTLHNLIYFHDIYLKNPIFQLIRLIQPLENVIEVELRLKERKRILTKWNTYWYKC